MMSAFKQATNKAAVRVCFALAERGELWTFGGAFRG